MHWLWINRNCMRSDLRRLIWLYIKMQAPQLWQGIAQHLAKSSPEVLVLIHPIHMTPTSHSQRALSVSQGSSGLVSGMRIACMPASTYILDAAVCKKACCSYHAYCEVF